MSTEKKICTEISSYIFFNSIWLLMANQKLFLVSQDLNLVETKTSYLELKR